MVTEKQAFTTSESENDHEVKNGESAADVSAAVSTQQEGGDDNTSRSNREGRDTSKHHRYANSSSSTTKPGSVAVDGPQVSRQLSRNDVVSGDGGAVLLANRDDSRVEVPDSAYSRHSAAASGEADESAETTQENGMMVTAELVTPPVEALLVSIDEPRNVGSHHHLHEHPPMPSYSGHSTEPDKPSHDRKRRKVVLGVVAVILVVVIAISIAVPLSSRSQSSSSDGPEPAARTTSSPTSAPTFSFMCYTSTFDILRAQMELAELPEAFIICPNTTIVVGVMKNPAENDFELINGDHPLTAIRKNVVIQCGLDGSRENNCVLSGGFMQVLLQFLIPTDEATGGSLRVNDTVDNLTVRGITFTGQLGTAGPFDGLSLSISHPGKNIRFEDCLWKDMIGAVGLIEISRNNFLALTDTPLEDGSIDVTFSDCSFHNVVFDKPVIVVRNQNVTLERCDFLDLDVSFLVRPCDFETIIALPDGCAGLFYCVGHSLCSFSDICVDEMEIEAPSLILHDNSTVMKVGGSNYLGEVDISCEMATVFPDGDTGFYNCSTVFEALTCPNVSK